MIDCPQCSGKGKIVCECLELVTVQNHPLNTVDYQGASGGQGYTVKQCRKCKRVLAVRWQYDHGSGSDDHVKDYGFGDPFELVKERHY